MRKVLFGVLGLAVAAQVGAAGPVLKVNGMPITEADLAVAQRVFRVQAGGQAVDEQTVLRRAVDQVIGRTLLLAAAKKAGVSVTPDEVKASVAEQESRVQDRAGFEAALTNAGVSQQDLERLEGERMLVARYVEAKIAPTISVSPEQVDAFYREHPEQFKHGDQIRIRMILIDPGSTDAEADAAARRKAEAALARVKAGEDFGKVAAEVSDDPTHSRGGEIGWVQKGMLLPSLDGPVFEQPDGGITDVLKSHYGYHIFQVEEHRAAGTYPLDEIRAALAARLQQQQTQEAVSRIVAEQRAKATIEVLDPALKAVLQAAAPPAPGTDGNKPD